MIELNNYTVQVNPYKMKSARFARGLKKTELSNLIGLSITSISNYENGSMNINKENLDKYSKVLNFPIDFFINDYEYDMKQLDKSPIFFRSSSVTNEIKDMYCQKYIHLLLVHKVLSEYLKFPELNIEVDNIFKEKGNFGYSNKEIEYLALDLRKLWGLGEKPIDNLLEIMVQNGIIISKIKTNIKATTDAFSQVIEDTPMIFLNKDRGTAVRDRFSLAHELGHIVLHSDIISDDIKNKDIYNQIEKEANRFASSFLLPSTAFSEDILTIDINSLIPLKKRWKVSLKGIIMRLRELDIIDDRQQRNNFIYISKKRWNISEPLDDIIENEEFNLYEEAFGVLFEGGVVDPKSVIKKIGIGVERIEEICNLNNGFLKSFMQSIDYKPKLRLIK